MVTGKANAAELWRGSAELGRVLPPLVLAFIKMSFSSFLEASSFAASASCAAFMASSLHQITLESSDMAKAESAGCLDVFC